MNIEEVKQLAKQGDREGAIAMLRQMLEQNEGERELVLLDWEWCIMPWGRQRKR